MPLRIPLAIITALCTLAAILVLAAAAPPARRVTSAPYVAPAVTPTQVAPTPARAPVVDEARFLARASSRSARPVAAQPTLEPIPVRVPTPAPIPEATPAPTPEPVAQITAVGDSVLLSATGALGNRLDSIAVDAAVGRDVGTALRVLQAQAAAGRLGAVVLVHIGNNGPFSAYQFQLMMQAIGDRPTVFVTLKVSQPWEADNNAMLAAQAARYPNITLVDWHGYGLSHSALFYDDGVHLRQAGTQAYAELVAPVLASLVP
ncbi:MAG: SGNH/GDSL hydrolase family protein [Chloroflexota bacterium]